MANPHRLPRTVLPRRYALTLTPHLGAATFDGHVDIDVEVAAPTAEVVLNAIELEIEQAWVTVGATRHEVTVTLDEDTERATLALSEPLPAGGAVVSLRFRGFLNDKLRGFYRSTFTDDHGVERVIATTQFETACRSSSRCSVIANRALKSGSSQHGNARRASVASNWVVAMTRSTPWSSVKVER